MDAEHKITRRWITENISRSKFMEEHDRLMLNHDEQSVIAWCRKKILKEITGHHED